MCSAKILGVDKKMNFFFVCFVGIDGSGKTTLSRNLVKNLKEHGIASNYVWNRYTPILMKIPMLVANKFIFKKNELFTDYACYSNKKKKLFRHSLLSAIYENLLMLDYIIQMMYKINIPLLRGNNIVCDRYLFDTIVSDLAVDLNYSESKIKSILDFYLIFSPKPNLIFLVDVPEDVAFRRKSDTPSIQYLKERRTICSTVGKLYNMIILDGTKTINELDLEILNLVLDRMGAEK